MKTTLILSVILFAICGLSFKSFTQVVSIPNAIFKAYLVGNASINTNSDSNIQMSEATAYTGSINVTYFDITNLTGIEAFTALTKLYCGDNPLTNLNLSANTALTTLHCGWNQLTSLNVSANTALTYLECSWNQLTSLNVKNGNNSNFTNFYAEGNPNSLCINVDNAAWSTENWIFIDAGASFSENCYVGISSLLNTSEIKTYPNPVQDELTVEISNSKFQTPNSKLEIINIQGQVLKNININDEITTIDLSNLASGLYTIKIITDNGITVKKLIKD